MTLTSTTEAERLIANIASLESDVAVQCSNGSYMKAADLTGRMGLLAPRLALLLRTSEEARVKAEMERDAFQSLAADALSTLCLQPDDDLIAGIKDTQNELDNTAKRAEAAETALGVIRRERDAAEAALVEAAEECVMPESLSDEALAAITAARSRKPDGEEKKL